jgi:hypothetical protein
MEQIRRQFGDKFAKALSKCPTLVADLQEIRAAGVKIRKLGGRCQAYSDRDKRTIYIGGRCGLSYKLISLAHEKVHVLVSLTPDPIPGKTGRQAFIDMCLNAETDAIVHEVVVAGELLAAGIAVDDHSMKWYRRFKRGGRAAIRKAIEQSYTSNTGERYPEYYGGWYDEVVKPKDRLPLRKLDGGKRRTGLTCCAHPVDLFHKGTPVSRMGEDFCPRFRYPVCETPVRLNLPVVDVGQNNKR